MTIFSLLCCIQTIKKIEKCKECNSPEIQYNVVILAGMRTEDFADQKLIHSLNRGGLYAVTPEFQALFQTNCNFYSQN